MNLRLEYNGNVLEEDFTRKIINYGRNELKVPPSFLITLLHYEGLWGGSPVARQNNNWGGMTWNSGWTSPHKRGSGVIVTRGSKRPSGEGGYYIKYSSPDDFLKDWFYLFRRGGNYRVADSKTFNDAVKGMFRYGGANYDYATMNVSTSKRRYELYLQGMTARRSAINKANNNILDKIDKGEDGIPSIELPDDSWDSNIIDSFPELLDSIKDIVDNTLVNVLQGIYSMLESNLFTYGDSFYTSNSFFTIEKIMENYYKIKPSGKFINLLKDISLDTQSNINDFLDKFNNNTEKNESQIPKGKSQPHFPTTPGLKVTSPYGYRVHPISGVRKFHAGTDWGGGGKTHPIYAVQKSKVTQARWSDSGGWMVYLEHIDDKYHSRYLHLNERPLVSVGDIVERGERIGTMGTTGSSTGIHLHLEIAKSQSGFGTKEGTIDPEKYLKMWF